MGDFTSSAGSFIALTGTPNVYNTAGINALSSLSAIDLVFCVSAASSNTSNAEILESTAAGVTNGDLTSSGWGTGNATIIVPVTGTAPTTVSQAKSAIGSSTNQSVTITTGGGTYVALLVDGTYAVLTVTSVTPGTTASGKTYYNFTLNVLKK